MAKLVAQVVPYSSVVCSSLTVHDESGRCIGQLGLFGFHPDIEDNAERRLAVVTMAQRLCRALNAGLAQEPPPCPTVAVLSRKYASGGLVANDDRRVPRYVEDSR